MIKVISFDIGGTIIKSRKKDKYNLKELAKVVDKPYDIVRKYYKEIFQKEKGDFNYLVNKFCDKLKIQVNNDILSFFQNKFNNDNNKISRETIKLLEKLKKLNYIIILFSNNCCLNNNNLPNDIINIVDEIFYSFDLGYTKEEEESFRIIEKKLGYKSEEFLHIGDTLTSDYEYPIKYGWNALYYGNKDNIRCISKLSDILKYLKG